MKLAFISDIHGNSVALKAVIEDSKERSIDKLFVLGDICYRGTEPKQSLNTDVIKGNADEWIVRGINEGEVPEGVHAMMTEERDWSVSKLNDTDRKYLQGLPEELMLEFGKLKIHAFHATPTSLFDVVQSDESNEELSNKLITRNADLFIYGHTHKPYVRFLDGKCIVNIGGVGLPFDGLKQASYGIVDIAETSFDISIVRVKYDVEKVIHQFESSDYPNKDVMIKVLEEANI